MGACAFGDREPPGQVGELVDQLTMRSGDIERLDQF
jgi:hypothetical protein